MKKITVHDLEKLCKDTEVLQEDKVYRTQTNKIIKIIYDRKLFSSSTIYPYAMRIKNNSRQLLAKQISTVDVQEIYYCPEKRVSVVLYPELAGIDCRKKMLERNFLVLEQLAKFVAFLHRQGIFFWDLHLGNILYREDGFSLIDIATVKVMRKMSSLKRARNISHLIAYKYDRELFQSYGFMKFTETYLAETKMSHLKQRLFLYHLKRRLDKKMRNT